MYAPLSTRNSSGLHPNLRGLGFLGDASLTPTTALQQALQAEGIAGNDDFTNDAWLSSAESDVAAGGISPSSFSPNCVSQPAPNINLFQTASGLAIGTSAAGIGILASTTVISTATAALAGAVTMGVGVLFAVLNVIFQHHAQAVKEEQQLGCAAIAAANNSLQLIDSAMQNGQTTADAASAALDNLISQLSSYLAPSVGHNPCNADCEVLTIYKAIVLYRKAVYADMAAQAAANAADYAAQQSSSQLTPAPPAEEPPVSEPVNVISPTPAPTTPVPTPIAPRSSMTSPAIPVTQFNPVITPAPSRLSAIPTWAWIAGAIAFAWAVL